ncbi:MAG: B12-binding domain-containing radical SAM protein [Candidatus Cloacimonas sp. 4484_209]|nr:MAG: B12-binding domain-containing radical SAM protein [Candidatus Cloacimonas sp. 4484_209]
MKILLVYPKYPDTFWSFKYALKFVSKKASFPPLGLLTVAALLPKEWEKKLIDMSFTALTDKDIKWADYVFISAMSVQRKDVKKVIARCRKLGTKIVAGGPLFTSRYEDFEGVDHFVLNEAELTLPEFLKDLQEGHPKHIYSKSQWPDITETPVPLWELVDMRRYASMCIQYSRGCPFNCEFCDVTLLFGHKVRVKTKDQIINELESLFKAGWRGGVFIVDDNFIGKKIKVKREILPAMIDWMEKRRHPFSFTTQLSINLADDEELMRLMSRAGFISVFVGIETPNKESLAECGKVQNKNRDLISSVKKIQKFGLQVQGGFIVGFDNDHTSIFERMITFIQKSGIVTAMVGLLNAPYGTRLYKRLVKEGRMLKSISGDNTDLSLNFKPKMDRKTLVNGYRSVLRRIYSPKSYYERVLMFLRNFKPMKIRKSNVHFYHFKAFARSIWRLGMYEENRIYYWKLFFWSLIRRPQLLPLAITFSIYGFHFRKIFKDY